jgi:hypothetical protein
LQQLAAAKVSKGRESAVSKLIALSFLRMI